MSLTFMVCHHLASLVMPIGDPWDGFFYPTLTVVMDSYNLTLLYCLNFIVFGFAKTLESACSFIGQHMRLCYV